MNLYLLLTRFTGVATDTNNGIYANGTIGTGCHRAVEREKKIEKNKMLNKTLNIIFSSSRPMPAHFSSNGDRGQSFCIDFEPLAADDDYEMASEAWYSVPNMGLTKMQTHSVLKCGEDIMLGSYVITKLGGESMIDDLKKEIIRYTIEAYNSLVENIRDSLSNDEAMKYFDHCAEFGRDRALKTTE